MFEWLNNEHVIQWYEKQTPTLDEVKTKYLPRIHGEEPVKPYLILANGVPMGYIQEYYLSDDPELKPYINGNFAGLDLFIGDPAYLGQGLGAQILHEFLRQVIFQEEEIEGCLVDPSPNNPRIIRVNEKVGFKHLATTTGPEPKYLMIIRREDMWIIPP